MLTSSTSKLRTSAPRLVDIPAQIAAMLPFRNIVLTFYNRCNRQWSVQSWGELHLMSAQVWQLQGIARTDSERAISVRRLLNEALLNMGAACDTAVGA